MINDIVDFSSIQHDQIRRLCREVDAAGPADKQRLFTELAELVNAHETSDREVVYPAVVDHTTGGAADGTSQTPSPSSGLQTGDGHRLKRPCVFTRIA